MGDAMPLNGLEKVALRVMPLKAVQEVKHVLYFFSTGNPPPRPARRVSPAEWAWLDRINRQLAYGEYSRPMELARFKS